MGYSKRQFVEAAFDEIGLASYVFDLQPPQLEACLRRLDSMIADWNGKGIRLGYPIPGSPQYSDMDEPSCVPDSAYEAIITNLAIRIAPSYGKNVSPATLSSAKNSYNTLLSRSSLSHPQQFTSNMPLGSGNKPWRTSDIEYMRRPYEGLFVGPDGVLDLNLGD